MAAALAGPRRLAALQRRPAAGGRPPAREVLDGALVIFGGAFLITPGFLTDIVGCAPAAAAHARGRAARAGGRLRAPVHGAGGGRRAAGAAARDWSPQPAPGTTSRAPRSTSTRRTCGDDRPRARARAPGDRRGLRRRRHLLLRRPRAPSVTASRASASPRASRPGPVRWRCCSRAANRSRPWPRAASRCPTAAGSAWRLQGSGPR